MIEDDFYATIKLKTGEEIFTKVSPCEEEDETLLLISNPIVVSEVKDRKGIQGYKIEPWLKTTTDDMFIINLSDVLTMTESTDIEMISMHQTFMESYMYSANKKSRKNKLTRDMGYISTVEEAKELLEKIFKSN